MNKINYTKIAKQLKVIAEPKRLKIINLLSNGEMCATDILKEFRVSQPTLSHDMKALVDEKFVTANRIGQKMIYSLNPDTIFDLQAALSEICNENINL
jgi:ArsR family transcriptional regulator